MEAIFNKAFLSIPSAGKLSVTAEPHCTCRFFRFVQDLNRSVPVFDDLNTKISALFDLFRIQKHLLHFKTASPSNNTNWCRKGLAGALKAFAALAALGRRVPLTPST
jgi:hypothetical protein